MILMLIFNFDYAKIPNFYFHCTGSLAFSVLMGTTVFLLFLLCCKKGTVFKIFTFTTAAILLSDLVLLFIFKETALIEALPIFAAYAMLNTVIFRRDKVEIKR